MPPAADASSSREPGLIPQRGGRRAARRWLIAGGLALALALAAGLLFFALPAGASGQFPSGMPEAERRQIVSAAKWDGLKRTLAAVRQGQFREAKRAYLGTRRQSVRAVGEQGGGMVWVHFGVEEPGATDGHAITRRYVMKRENGRWVVSLPLF